MVNLRSIALVMSSAGSVLYLISGLAFAAGGLFGFGASRTNNSNVIIGPSYFFLIPIFMAILIATGTLLMSIKRTRNSKTGPVMVMLFSILAAPFTLGGLFIGIVLCVAGSGIILFKKKPSHTNKRR
ncbi:hypothetical protein M1293_00065 [Candidatus Parvarchaeota archaeon]|nr:hypothetical protein [Candidatus Parvarchaeota archaeon]